MRHGWDRNLDWFVTKAIDLSPLIDGPTCWAVVVTTKKDIVDVVLARACDRVC